MEFCGLCDCTHVPNALQCNRCRPEWWARGWKCNRCYRSCVHSPDKFWLHGGWICKWCQRIPGDWRNHADLSRKRRRLIKSYPKVLVIVRDLAGNDYLRDSVDDEPKQFSPVQKIEDVVGHLRIRLQMWNWEKIVICKDAEVLKQATWLGTLADATGEVHLSAARFSTNPAEMAQAALKRAKLYAEEGAWGAWSRALSEASSWEAEERFREWHRQYRATQ